MKAGRLRHRVTFEQPGPLDIDSDGAEIPSWVPVFSGPVSAEIMALSGRELIAAQAVQSEVTTRIKVRYKAQIAAGMRALHRSVVYNIEGVIPDPDSGIRHLTLICTSGVNEG